MIPQELDALGREGPVLDGVAREGEDVRSGGGQGLPDSLQAGQVPVNVGEETYPQETKLLS